MHTQCEESNLHVTFLIYDQLCHAPKARNGTLLQNGTPVMTYQEIWRLRHAGNIRQYL